ncbi:MAG: M2 family metallopeptidase [Gemmatimonadetes bacterium]|nr:M2 family metallopeptidase [Gemmatimonadota bacterium]
MFSHRTPWLLSVPLFALASGCGGAGNGESGGEGEVPENAAQREAAAYLAEYADTYQGLYYTANKADWAVNTRIVDGDTTNAARYRRAREALAAFEGSVDNIERIRGLLDERDELAPLQTLQLAAMLFNAAQYPATVPELVSERIAAETEQVETLYGFEFTLNGDPITPNRIDELLRTSSDLAERRSVWEASKEVGPALKEGIVELRDLRNATVQSLGYPDFFSYQVSEYGMTSDEMLALTDSFLEQLRPLYRELHTWVRYELAERYGQPVPEMIPADWLPNRWAQDWSALVRVEGLNIEPALGEKTAEWVVDQGEEFYLSLGFGELPDSFWELSSLYPLPPEATYKKNTHASAWHLDVDRDVRSLMSVEPNREWWETALHELGHIYYYISYSTPEVPLVLRGGANRAYHEGIGSLMGLASLQRSFLVNRGLVPADAEVDAIAQLLQEALNYIVFMPFSAGTMTRFEHALYAEGLPADRFNAKWWELVRRYQGVVPPAPRGEEYADAITKTHISDDPGQYYDYAISYALLFQLHEHIAREILRQDPHDTDYWGSMETGDLLRQIMAPGMSRSWRDVLQETTGRGLDAQAMVEYFQPLYEWLVEGNTGREATLPNL